MTALEERVREQRALTEMLPTQLWTAAPDGSITWTNRATHEFRGRPPHELVGQPVWRDAMHPDDLEDASAQWQRSLETGHPYDNEARLRRHDGVFKWHFTRAVARRDARGAITAWYGSTTDVDDYKRFETQRERLIGTLRARNFDLQRFAYALARDVNTPLRAISNLATWISEDLGAHATSGSPEGAPPEISANLTSMRARVLDLSQLVDALLREAVSGPAHDDRSQETPGVVRDAIVLVAPPDSARDLPAMRRFVEASGGAIAIEATPDGGATISLTWQSPRP